MKEVDYVDPKGIPRRVLVNDEYDDPAKGIITSIYLDEELRNKGWADYQITRLYQELWKRGLVLPTDFQSESHALMRSALMAVMSIDVQQLETLAEAQQNGRTHSSPKRVSGR